jgi:hypothetical protein
MRPLLLDLPLTSARREQGAIELYRRCCEERRCLSCPGGSVRSAAAGGLGPSRARGRARVPAP